MSHIVGIDEVGRGALAGPVVVCAAGFLGSRKKLLSDLEKVLRRGLTDSKKLTRLQRERAASFLRARVMWSCGEASPIEIDSLGLSAALKLAAGRAIDGLPQLPTYILADAGLFHPHNIPTENIVKGDEKIPEISVASILAKVHRDALMHDLSGLYMAYNWEKNVGYGTPAHYMGLKKAGLSPEHRRLFCKRLS